MRLACAGTPESGQGSRVVAQAAARCAGARQNNGSPKPLVTTRLSRPTSEEAPFGQGDTDSMVVRESRRRSPCQYVHAMMQRVDTMTSHAVTNVCPGKVNTGIMTYPGNSLEFLARRAIALELRSSLVILEKCVALSCAFGQSLLDTVSSGARGGVCQISKLPNWRTTMTSTICLTGMS